MLSDSDKFLNKLPEEIFSETYNTEEAYEENETFETQPVYDDEICLELAEALLSEDDYDPTCRYILSTERDCTTLQKIHPKDRRGRVLTETIPLVSNDVEPLHETVINVHKMESKRMNPIIYSGIPEVKHDFLAWSSIIFICLCFVGVVMLAFVFSLF